MKHQSILTLALLVFVCGIGPRASGQTASTNKTLATVTFVIDGNLQVTQSKTNKCAAAVPPSATVESSQFLSGTLSLAEVCTNWGNPTCAVFEASIKTSQRTSDWRGTHEGVFRLSCGASLLGLGTMSGMSGLTANPGPDACSHHHGTMRGLLRQGNSYTIFQAGYLIDLTDVDCPSVSLPKGPFHMTIDGVASIPRCEDCGP
jgi:hypothetical protein